MWVAVLGTIEAGDGDDLAALSPQLRRLLGLLVTADGGSVSADRLAEYIADGNVEGSTVRTAVSRLRKVLGNRVQSADNGYRVQLEADELDAARFEQLVGRARSAEGEIRIAALSQALGLWRGPALDGLAHEEWAAGWAARLEGLRSTAVEDLAEAFLGEGRWRDASELLDEHARNHPYRERPVILLMRALHAQGRTAEGLRVFERFRVTLRDDTGLEPSAELRAVETELLANDADDSSTAPLPTGTVTFLFTDIEGSTERWADDEQTMTAALTAHDALLRTVVAAHDGAVLKHTGDGICAVFASASAAVTAATEAQRQLELPVRMGVHTGEADLRDGDYFGPTLNRVARIMDAGHGGQILISRSTASLVPDIDTTDLGEHRLKGLASSERIFQLGPDEHPPLRVATARTGNLPEHLTSFVGRGAELTTVVDHLADHRLVTLLGVGGTGKTRLAIEAGHVLAPTFPDGCWIIELARVSVPEAVPIAVCAGLGIVPPESGDAIDLLERRLRNERRLIVLDNCEHLLDAAAEVVERLVEHCPSVSVVATSREPLMVAGEHLTPTPSLSHDDAVELFLERARSEAPDLLFDEPQMEAIDQLCDRLDRLPLAIELAASRMRSMSPIDAVHRLDQRFRLLVGGRRSRMERHQTMRGTVEWSYELCTEDEQQVFDCVSVFPSSFDLDAAAATAGDGVTDRDRVEDTISRLVDRSLVQRQVASGGASQFRLLETMRAYGHERLSARGEADQIRERHASYVGARVGAFSLRALGPDEDEVHASLRALAADGLVALDWSLDDGDWGRAYRIACAFYYASPGVTFALMERMHQRRADAPDGSFDDGYGALTGLIPALLAGVDPIDPDDKDVLGESLDHFPLPAADHWAFGPVMGLDPDSESRNYDYIGATDRLLAAIDDAPPILQFQEWISAAEGAIWRDGDAARPHLAVAVARLRRAEELAEELSSETARRRCVAVALLIADVTDVVGDVLDRARRALSRVVEPSGGDMYAASRYLRVAAKCDAVTRHDLVRPLEWALRSPTPIAVGHAQISTVVALLRLGNEALAARVAATIDGERARSEMARIHRDSITEAIYDHLVSRPDANLPLADVFDELVTYAETLPETPDRVAGPSVD